MSGVSTSPPDRVSTEAEPSGGPPFLVVGVGASAGGLEAVAKLLDGLAPGTSLAVLVVLHLDPHVKSELPAILGRTCRLPVVEAAQGLRLAGDRVYVCPSDKNIALTDGEYALVPRPPRGPNMPVDHLFRSLAEVHRSRALGVVLSGDGTDGALGLQAIKGEGGIGFAQDEDSARHPSMPRAAALDGSIDYVLPPQAIAAELLRLARHSFARSATAPAADSAAAPALADGAIDQLIAFIRANTNVDFTHYKRTTIRRRIQRRMALRGLESAGISGCGAPRHRGVAGTLPGLPHPRHPVLPRLRRLRGARAEGLPRPLREPPRRLARSHLGGRLRHRRGGLLAGHRVARVHGRPDPVVPRQDPRDRPQRAVAGEGAGRRLRR